MRGFRSLLFKFFVQFFYSTLALTCFPNMRFNFYQTFSSSQKNQSQIYFLWNTSKLLLLLLLLFLHSAFHFIYQFAFCDVAPFAFAKKEIHKQCFSFYPSLNAKTILKCLHISTRSDIKHAAPFGLTAMSPFILVWCLKRNIHCQIGHNPWVSEK